MDLESIWLVIEVAATVAFAVSGRIKRGSRTGEEEQRGEHHGEHGEDEKESLLAS